MSDSSFHCDSDDGAADDGPSAAELAKEISAMFVAALLLVLGCVLLGSVVPLVHQNMYALVAAIFVGLPYWWLTRRGANFERFGLTWKRVGAGVCWGLATTAVVVGPFWAGYWWWETRVRERTYDFSTDNFWKWPVDYEGRPDQWGQSPGVWVWSDGPELHVGVRSGVRPVDVHLEADRPFEPTSFGAATLSAGADAGEPTSTQAPKQWTMHLKEAHRRAEVVVDHRPGGSPPRHLSIDRAGPSPTIHRGSAASRVDGPIDISRGLWWIVLWTLTQVVFIALPEEFFYRGYLLTRLKQMFDARRGSSGPAGGSRRTVWGISAENALTSLLFAVGHVLIPIGGVLVISRASVFFPALLFGWLRERTGTIAAPVIFHAGANMMVLLAAPHLF